MSGGYSDTQVYACLNNGFKIYPETCFSHDVKNHLLKKDFVSNFTPRLVESEYFE